MLSLILSKKILKANHNFSHSLKCSHLVVFNIVKENSESKSQPDAIMMKSFLVVFNIVKENSESKSQQN